MATTIWKFIADDVCGAFELEMPKGAKILAVQTQSAVPCIWAHVDPAAELETRIFQVYGTGHRIYDHALVYVGTFQLAGGSLVFHIFEEIKA